MTGGGHDKQSRQLGDLAPKRFTADTAETIGRAERSVQLDAERGRAPVAPHTRCQPMRYGRVILGRLCDSTVDIAACPNLTDLRG